jgi:hypothetical protein
MRQKIHYYKNVSASMVDLVHLFCHSVYGVSCSSILSQCLWCILFIYLVTVSMVYFVHLSYDLLMGVFSSVHLLKTD